MNKAAASGIMLILLLMSMLTLAFNIQPVKTEPTAIIVPDHYPTIQNAINAADSGDTIFVRAGTYYENVTVDKSVTLVGEDPNTTIIDGGGAQVVVVYIKADHVKVSGFTIRNSGDDPPGNPWPLKSGICLEHANNSIINGNIIESNSIGIFTYYSRNSTIYNNTISNNGYNLDLRYLSYSKIYHNSLINNWLWQLYRWETSNNIWHDGVGRGNYWSDYQGEDIDGDDVGDTLLPHQGADHHPLMSPWAPPYRPMAKFTHSPLYPRVNEMITLDASYSVPGWNETDVIPIISYAWDFGDGNTTTTVNSIITHAYSVNDTYIITLNITDSQGLWDITSRTITVSPPHGPTAKFTCSLYYPRVNWTVTFNASVSLPGWNGTQETSIVSYEWSFGDGTTPSTETDPLTTHVYTTEGNYTVTLKITDSEGGWNTTSETIIVCPSPSGLTAIGLRDTLELQMTIPNATIVIGETIDITLTLRNAGCNTLTVRFGSSQSFDVYLCFIGCPIAAWSYDKYFWMWEWDLSLEPGETYTGTLSWNFYLYFGTGQYYPPNPGNYSLVGLCIGCFLDSCPVVITSELPITLEGARIDLNNDGIVDIDDIVIVATAFGSYPGHSRWNVLADIDQDGIVDIEDVVIIAINFGKII